MTQALAILAGAGLTACIKPDGINLRISPAKHLTQDLRKFITQHKADILAELKAANDSGALDTTHPTPLAWLAARGIYLEATGVWLQNISIQTNSVFPDDEAVAYISAHATEILSTLVAIKTAELATTQQPDTT